MTYSKMPYNIYNAYWKCTMFCSEIDFWSSDWCKQLSTWEGLITNSRCQEKLVPGLQQPGCLSLLAGTFHPPIRLTHRDIPHLSSESRCSRHLEIKRRQLAIKYAGVPRPHDALQIFTPFSPVSRKFKCLSFLTCWWNRNVLAHCSE